MHSGYNEFWYVVMSSTISRAQFLRGDFSSRNKPLRPPWALSEAQFLAACTACGECIPACSLKLLRAGSGGYPQLSFAAGGCSFCGDCLKACTTGALVRKADPWTLKAQVSADCLAAQGVMCSICAEHCDARAIRIRPALGGRAQPQINNEACTGCGACFSVCPNQSISLVAADLPSLSPQPLSGARP